MVKGSIARGARCLILAGLGSSAVLLADYRERWPDHVLWTMCRGYTPGSSRHFEIHFDRRVNRAAVELAKADGVPVTISPFHTSGHPLEQPFPIDAVAEKFGVAYYELTTDYLLAYAALEREAGRLAFDVIALPGQDFNDGVHFMGRGGATYWHGWFNAKGVHIEKARDSTLLQRRPSILSQINPFHGWGGPIYGQPPEVTREFCAKHGIIA